MPTAGGIVWNDKNEDWEQNHNEKGLGSISINLIQNGKTVATTKTDSRGAYRFNDIKDENYKVDVVVPKGYKAITLKSHEFWEDKSIFNLNFGLLKNKITPPDTNEPITLAQLKTMIKNGDDVTKVNTSKITNMSHLFEGRHHFNQDISNWDTSKVTDMSFMFHDANDFNQNIGKWNVSNVTNMESMFAGHEHRAHPRTMRKNKFNQDIGNWDVSNVTNMNRMFAIGNFNQNISKWNVSNVTEWRNIFSPSLHHSPHHGVMSKENSPAKLYDLKGHL